MYIGSYREKAEWLLKGAIILGSFVCIDVSCTKRVESGQNTFVAFIEMEKAFDWIDHDLLS